MITPITNFRPSVTPKQNTQNNKKNGSNVNFKAIIPVVSDKTNTVKLLLIKLYMSWDDFFPMSTEITDTIKANPLTKPALTNLVEKGKKVSLIITDFSLNKYFGIIDNNKKKYEGNELLKLITHDKPLDLDMKPETVNDIPEIYLRAIDCKEYKALESQKAHPEDL